MALSNKKKILILGVSPNEIGGVALHVKRLSEYLKNEFYFVFLGNNKNNSKIRIALNTIKEIFICDVIHIHDGNYLKRIFYIFFARLFNKKIIITIHHDPSVEGRMAVKLNKIFLRFCEEVILVNQIGYDLFIGCGSKTNYHLMYAFIPPLIDAEQKLPENLSKWINEQKKKKHIIAVSNAFQLKYDNNGVDLYGLDMCIDVVERLVDKGFMISCIFVIPNPNVNQKYIDSCEQEILQRGLNEYFLIWKFPISFVNLINESTIVLRPTTTDGDALSIREALYLGKPIIASNVVHRPEGTTTFNSRDINDFYCKIINSISITQQIEKQKEDLNFYLDFYRNIYK